MWALERTDTRYNTMFTKASVMNT